MRRTLVYLLIITISITATGCWSKDEIEDLGFAMGIGISKTDKGLYEVIVQFANPGAVVADNPDQRDIYTIVRAQGISVFDAFRNLSMVAGRRLYFPHLKVVLIQEDVARDGINEIMGFLKQDEEIRLGLEVLICKLPPEEIFDTPNTLGVIPALGLDIVAERAGANDKVYVADLRETIGIISNPYGNYVTGFVEIIPAPTELEKEFFKISKIAVFDGDKLVDYLDYEEGQAYRFVTGIFENGLIVFEKRNKDILGIEMLGANSKVTPKFTNGKIGFDIEITGEGNLAERIPVSRKDNDIQIGIVKEQLDKVIEDKINKAIDRAQNELKVDYFNLSKPFFRKYPREFKELMDDWNYHFTQAEFNVSVDISIIHPALGTFGGQE